MNHTVTLSEGQIALIGLIFEREFNEIRHGESQEENLERTATELEVMAEILKTLGIDDEHDCENLAKEYRHYQNDYKGDEEGA